MERSHFVHPYSFMPDAPLAERWQRLKPVISKLYIDEGRKLDDVIEILRVKYGFDASKHQYKYHIRQWKLKKSIPKKVKGKMYEIIEYRATLGKSTLLEYKGKIVDSRKLVRHAKDQSNKSLIHCSVFKSNTDSATKQNGPPLHMASAIFLKWNMPYGAFRNSRGGGVDHHSPRPIGPSPASDIVATTPSYTGVLSPSANSPSQASKAAFSKIALERAYLFIGGKHNELIQSMGKQETITMSTWLYQFWMFAFRTARHWGKGPKDWTKELLDLDKHMEKLSISAAPTPGMIAPSPVAAATPAPCWPADGITPSILCHWGVHVPYLYYEPIDSRNSDDLDLADDPGNPHRDWKDWPRSWSKPSFVDRLRNGLRCNLFSDIEEEDLPVAIPRLLQNTDTPPEELLEEALGFSIIGRNVDALYSVLRKMRRSKKGVETLFPFHLATSYLSGCDPCCNVFSFMIYRPSLFPLKELYINDKGHSVLDNLLIAILKSHTRCVPADVDDNMKHYRRFEGEEVDICGRWDADSDELRALLARGEPRIPFEWKHKFCHTSVQVICHCISFLFTKRRAPDINSPSGLFRKKCQHCGHESKLLPLHAMVMTAILLAERGTTEEDLFGMVACLLCLLRKGAEPSLTTEISVDALWGISSSTACLHESLDAVQLAERVPAIHIQNWSPAARTGWKLFCYVLRTARRLGEPNSPSRDVIMWDEPQSADDYFHPFLQFTNRDTHIFPTPRRQADDDEDSVDEEISWCNSCSQPNNFIGRPELRDLWAAVQAEILTYRRLEDWHNWLSDNFNMEEIITNLEAGNGVQTGFFQKGLLREFCDCGGFKFAKQPDFTCVDDVCREYFSNLEQWERTTYLWCPEEIVEEDEINDMLHEEEDESDDDDDDDDDDELAEVYEIEDGSFRNRFRNESQSSSRERYEEGMR